MSITLLYFGVLKDVLGRSEETLAWDGGSSTALLAQLRTRGEDWAAALAPGKVFRLVVNQQIVHGEVPVPDGAEVGILPPVTGG
ncbi:MoaD/ThiS family protein [Vogesella fluminis]|uniref:Molybdopterin synthase sulfur carrier subunit n=1 Tax=Vogesella fluminis TaxID=1069161 RepID=A0ABQ3H7S4_9NEIS|nr:MoaD/ThiS family protein [Vogesella fluminis]GHD74758.1 molybdopterin synthase sulfur carrier subunit [Vogesella fluminis]